MEGEGRRAGAGGGPGDVRWAGARAEGLRGSAANTWSGESVLGRRRGRGGLLSSFLYAAMF